MVCSPYKGEEIARLQEIFQVFPESFTSPAAEIKLQQKRELSVLYEHLFSVDFICTGLFLFRAHMGEVLCFPKTLWSLCVEILGLEISLVSEEAVSLVTSCKSLVTKCFEWLLRLVNFSYADTLSTLNYLSFHFYTVFCLLNFIILS